MPKKKPPIPCTALACPRSTYFGKPYCVDHIGRMPYVVELLTEQARLNLRSVVLACHPRAETVSLRCPCGRRQRVTHGMLRFATPACTDCKEPIQLGPPEGLCRSCGASLLTRKVCPACAKSGLRNTWCPCGSCMLLRHPRTRQRLLRPQCKRSVLARRG